MNGLNYQQRKSNKPLAVCELVQHPRGAFQINGIPLRPEWPIGLPLRLYDRAREIVNFGVDAANKVYDGKEEIPKRVRVEVYSGRRMRAIVRE